MRPRSARALPRLAPAAAVVVVSVLVLLLGQGAAIASCAPESGPGDSPLVLVGTPTESRGGFTRLAVSEVWRGPDLAEEVWVLSAQEQPPWPMNLFQGVSSSNDADLREGADYVLGVSESFHTDDCAIRRAGSRAELQALRPSDSRMPTVNGLTGADPPLPGWATWALAVTGGSASWVAVRAVLRRRAR